MNAHPRIIEAASSVRLSNVSDHLSEAHHILEAVWMAAANINEASESEAIRTVLHLAQRLVEGARDDIDAFRATQSP